MKYIICLTICILLCGCVTHGISAKQKIAQKEHDKKVLLAMEAASKELPNFWDVITIYVKHRQLFPMSGKSDDEFMQKHKYEDIQKKYWEFLYLLGTNVVEKKINDPRFKGPQFCFQKSEHVTMVLRIIKESLEMQIEERNMQRENVPIFTNPSPSTWGNPTNSYDPIVHQDEYGRPVKYVVPNGCPGELLQVKPNAYGPGVGMDQYGRPVQIVPAF